MGCLRRTIGLTIIVIAFAIGAVILLNIDDRIIDSIQNATGQQDDEKDRRKRSQRDRDN